MYCFFGHSSPLSVLLEVREARGDPLRGQAHQRGDEGRAPLGDGAPQRAQEDALALAPDRARLPEACSVLKISCPARKVSEPRRSYL